MKNKENFLRFSSFYSRAYSEGFKAGIFRSRYELGCVVDGDLALEEVVFDRSPSDIVEINENAEVMVFFQKKRVKLLKSN